MEYTLVFDAAASWAYLVPPVVFSILGLVLFLSSLTSPRVNMGGENWPLPQRVGLRIVGLVFLAGGLGTDVHLLLMRHQILSKSPEQVEGYVVAFNPIRKKGDLESFRIEGSVFTYAPSILQPGFSGREFSIQDGMYLRVSHVGKLITKIEQAVPSPAIVDPVAAKEPVKSPEEPDEVGVR